MKKLKKKNVFKKYIKSITSKMFKTLLSSNRKYIYVNLLIIYYKIFKFK